MASAQAQAEKDKGNEAYKKKDFVTAHQHYDKAIELDPTNVTFLTNKAAAYFEEQKYDDCIKCCEKAVEIGRENRADYHVIAKAYSRMANAYLKQEKLKEALQFFDKSLSEHRDPEIVKKRNEIDKIFKQKEREAYINPELALEEKNKGNECYQKGAYAEAIKHYTEAIKRNPQDAKLYSNRAACYTKLMEFNYCISDCDECIKLDPTFVKGYLRKGAACSLLKQYGRAKAVYEEALRLDPNNQEALDGLRAAMIGGQAKNPEEIRKKAMEDPEIRQILSDPAMSMILEQMSQDPKAVREHLKNPDIMKKIEKLMDAGIVGMR
jgi:stress-induced-phosphoprotein 1